MKFFAHKAISCHNSISFQISPPTSSQPKSFSSFSDLADGQNRRSRAKTSIPVSLNLPSPHTHRHTLTLGAGKQKQCKDRIYGNERVPGTGWKPTHITILCKSLATPLKPCEVKSPAVLPANYGAFDFTQWRHVLPRP